MAKKIVISKKHLSSVFSSVEEVQQQITALSEQMEELNSKLDHLGQNVRELSKQTKERIEGMQNGGAE